jgi:hypothetical protein
VLTRRASGFVDRSERSCSRDAPLGFGAGLRDRAHQTDRFDCGQTSETGGIAIADAHIMGDVRKVGSIAS